MKINKPIPTKSNMLERINNIVPISSIVDVGVRECTYELIRAFPSYKHYLFEPVGLFFDSIRRNYAEVDYELFPIALSNENSYIYLILTSLGKDGIVTHSKISSEAVNVDGLQTVACQPIEVKRFDSLNISMAIAHNFLLKVDVDGQDLNVIKGFGDSLQLASVVIIECTFISAVERIAFLQNSGFELIDMVDLVYYGPSLYQFDAVLIRKDLIYEFGLSGFSLRPPIAKFNRELWSPLVFS